MPRLSSLAVTCLCAVACWTTAPVGFSSRAAAAAPAMPAFSDGCGTSAQARTGDAVVARAGAMAGRVLDEQLEPLAGAVVSAQRVRFTNGEPRAAGDRSRPSRGATSSTTLTAVTNDRGEYRLEGLQPGQYHVSALVKSAQADPTPPRDPRRRRPNVGYGPTFYPGTTYVAQALPVRVRAGEDVTGIDIRLEKKRLARVSGKVVTARERLHEGGASVTLAPSPTLGPGRVEGFLGHSPIAADGAFTIENVPPGEYVLKTRSIPASVINEIAMTGRSAPLTRDPDAEFGAVPVTVDGEDVADLSVVLSPGGRLTGRILLDGHPFTPDRSDASDVSLRAEPADADAFSPGASEVPVRADGTFEIRGLTGRFVLRVGELPPALTLARVEYLGSDVTDSGLMVRPREEVSSIDIVLSSKPTELTGRILADSSGTPGHCAIIVFSADPARWLLPASRYVASAMPERSGVFSITGLPPGTYLAVAVPNIEEDEWLDPAYLKRVSARATEVRLREGESRVLTLRVN